MRETTDRGAKVLAYLVFVAFSFALLLIRLFYLQYVKYDENLQKSENNRMRSVVLRADRGAILTATESCLCGTARRIR